MKVLKIIGIIILVIVILGAGAVIFGPTEVHMQRETTIDAPAEAVFAEIKGFKTFDQYSAWSEIDTTATIRIEGPATGVGASYSWESDNPDLGKGRIEIIEMEDMMLKSKMSFEGYPGEPSTSWILSEEDGKTKVVYTYDETNISGIWKLFSLGTEGMLAPMYDRTLEKLKTRIENRPELSAKISIEDVDPITFAGMEVSVSNDMAEISRAMGEAYGAIMAAITANNLEMAEGYPLAIATSYSETNLSMICGIPVVEESSIEDGDVSVMQSPDGKAIRALHFGDYALLEITHEQINQYAQYYGYELTGNPWEIYVTDPSVETDTSKWVTEVYYPTN
ncbi:SRPBCC family protein [Ekhidna sp.]|uniref:SRPBCC family protein n=1 Tax=Ekhidna sp. TaxID=2608089 RepID=UPI00329A12D5